MFHMKLPTIRGLENIFFLIPGYCALKIDQCMNCVNFNCGKHKVQNILNSSFYGKISTEPETINNMAN